MTTSLFPRPEEHLPTELVLALMKRLRGAALTGAEEVLVRAHEAARAREHRLRREAIRGRRRAREASGFEAGLIE